LPDFSPQIIAVSGDGAHVTVREPLHPITIRTLLSHSSGISFSSAIETPTLDLYPLSTRVQSYALERLMFEPGAHFYYSNAGINIVARVIETVSGLRYEEFLEARLFRPLKMTDTTFWPDEAQLTRLAKSYKPTAAGNDLEEVSITQLHYPLNDHAHRYPMPAGGLFSTARDLSRFCQMLLNDGELSGIRYVSKGAIEEMARNQLTGTARDDLAQTRSSPTDPDGYGLGWFTTPAGAFNHEGAYSTNMRIDPEHGLALIWLVQHAGFPGEGSKSESAFERVATERFAKQ
jgi:CubicO group peptidase (beta-lactamase class C family)